MLNLPVGDFAQYVLMFAAGVNAHRSGWIERVPAGRGGAWLALGLGLGMMVSAVTTKYRDLSFVVTFGVPLFMYTTTVIFPLSTAVSKYPAFSWVIKYNPVTAIIETFRYGFMGKASFSWELLGYSAGITFIILLAGIITFNKVERTFVDTI